MPRKSPRPPQTGRLVHDSLGEIRVPKDALYGAQTMRAVQNFQISGEPMPRKFIDAVLMIKIACARTNHQLKLLPKNIALTIERSAQQLRETKYNDQFPVDIFQTGSGTSTNMNCNEVIAELGSRTLKKEIHPNNHVNMSQSSNDVIPTAMHISAACELKDNLRPMLKHLHKRLRAKANLHSRTVKTGRTHLMDAMPLTLKQEMMAWASQIEDNLERLAQCQVRINQLAQGGTAIGSGINAHPRFSKLFITHLNRLTGMRFSSRADKFAALASQDTVVELSGNLNTLAVSLMKIANDLRWMNSGPLTGLGEISLPVLQPGSSIMPGKVNPVIPESVAMVCAAVMGNHTSITVAGQSGNFQLNVMLPLLASRLLDSLGLLACAARSLADQAIAGFTVNKANLSQPLEKNPILVTALNAIVGYDLGAKIAKEAYQTGQPVLDVACKLTKLDRASLKKMLDPMSLTNQD